MQKLLILSFVISSNKICVAQNYSGQVLSIQDFIAKVKQHHPLAKVANIAIEKANANLLTAKGGFDPVLELDARQKTFDSKNYYTYNNAELKLPLPIGDFKTGIEKNNGQFLESEITSGRSSYAGVEFPIAKGLMIDKRRAFLQQAKIAIQLNTAQQRALVNDLLLDAYESYYQWAGDYKLYNIFSGFVNISNDRLRLTRISQQNGDRAVMDTIEAFAQLQNFIVLQGDAQIKMMSSKFMLNNFLWDVDGVPQIIAQNVSPDTSLISGSTSPQPLLDLIQLGNTQNPILLQSRFKINILEVDKRLKFQGLLPTINLKGNILSKDFYTFKSTGAAFLDNNNYWGIDIKIPLRFREGRGEYRMAKLKIEESNWELKQKTLETENKINNYFNQFTLIEKQLLVANTAFRNYNALLRNELLRFNSGESSLFLVNTRENKVLEMQQKLVELQVKLLKSKYGLDWAAGIIE